MQQNDPTWEDAAATGPQVGRSLIEFGVTLLAKDLGAETAFLTQALGLEIIRNDGKFAVLRMGAQPLILHQDATYASNPLYAMLPENEGRGLGVELRLYGVDPDEAWRKAEAVGGVALREPQDRPHGLRECVLLSPAGYAWVPGAPISDERSAGT